MYCFRFPLPLLIAAVFAVPVSAQFTDRNDSYLRGAPPVAQGIPFDQIRNSVGRQVGGTYIGMGQMPAQQRPIYRLRFMRDGVVFDVYVDARTGQIIARGGN
ncbi:MAG: PepSY domain-containing protein [Polymorphobacter sp.]